LGIIENQGIKGTIYSYIGVVIGFVTAGILMPRFLTLEQNGVFEMLVTWSMVFATLATLGINSVTNRLFPYFRDGNSNHKGFFTLISFVLLAGLVLSTGLYLILRPAIIRGSLDKSVMLVNYIDLVIPLMIFTAIFLVVDIYYAVLYNAVKGIFLKELLQRIIILVVLLFFYFKIFDFSGLVMAYVGALSLPGVLILVSLARDGELVFRSPIKNIDSSMAKSIASVAVFGIAVTFSNSLIQYVDRIMINDMLGLADAGLYGRVFFYGTLVVIPLRPLSKISSVVVAQAWKDERHDEVKSIYYKSTLDQLLVGLLVFVGIMGNIDNVIYIMGPEFEPGRNVVLFIGLSNLFVMAAGVSGAIISTSRHYRILSVFILIFGIMVVLTNLVFIRVLGITGAALASAISALAYSLMRIVFLKRRYQMQPFNYRHLLVLIIGTAAYFSSTLIPGLVSQENFILTLVLDIILRSLAMAVVYIALVYIFKLSPDLRRFVLKMTGRYSG
jgi:O-antigen/teichoic acid export membrane protein